MDKAEVRRFRSVVYRGAREANYFGTTTPHQPAGPGRRYSSPGLGTDVEAGATYPDGTESNSVGSCEEARPWPALSGTSRYIAPRAAASAEITEASASALLLANSC